MLVQRFVKIANFYNYSVEIYGMSMNVGQQEASMEEQRIYPEIKVRKKEL